MASRLEKKCADLTWPHSENSQRKRRSTDEYSSMSQDVGGATLPVKSARMNLIADQEHMPKKNKPKKEATPTEYITKVYLL